MSLLSASGVTKRFGGLVAVNRLDLEIAKHSISSIIGPNGAGKTTLFNCITGYYQPEEGEILFDDRSIKGLSPDRITCRGIARTYQNIRLFANMSAIENILVGQHTRLKSNLVDAILHTPRYHQEDQIALGEANRLISFLGLSGLGDHLARNLPYGAQRRLEIARALASKPHLMLLDEPTAGMNPRETRETMEFIQHLRDDLGITIILIEHDMRVVMGISEWITVLDYGEKIAEGTPSEIQRNTRVIEAYLGRGAASGIALQESG